jgi:hypothetical protein
MKEEQLLILAGLVAALVEVKKQDTSIRSKSYYLC